MNIADIWARYSQYQYFEIYWSVSDYSLLGKKRKITNRINSARHTTSQAERNKLLDEVNSLVTEMHELTKRNGNKLVDIGRIINR